MGDTVAVAGASSDTSKYWYRIYKDTKDYGFEAFCINPKFKDLDGEPVYANLASVPKHIDILVLVVPPSLTLPLVEEAVKLKVREVWFQPHTFNEQAAKLAKDNGMIVHDSCFMVENNIW